MKNFIFTCLVIILFISVSGNTYPFGYQNDMQNRERYSQFIDDVLWNSQEEEGIKKLQELIKLAPDNPLYLYDLARLYYSIKNYEENLNILDRIKNVFPQFSECRINYLYAKNLFAIDKTDEGLDCYMSAITSIQDSVDMKMFYDDVCYIMNDDEYDEYKTTPIDSIGNFYSRFWRSRDPDLATERNERIVEHYKRLSYAWKNYRRYNFGKEAYDFTNETAHYSMWEKGYQLKSVKNF